MTIALSVRRVAQTRAKFPWRSTELWGLRMPNTVVEPTKPHIHVHEHTWGLPLPRSFQGQLENDATLCDEKRQRTRPALRQPLARGRVIDTQFECSTSQISLYNPQRSQIILYRCTVTILLWDVVPCICGLPTCRHLQGYTHQHTNAYFGLSVLLKPPFGTFTQLEATWYCPQPLDRPKDGFSITFERSL
jgi:hypothetical protein